MFKKGDMVSVLHKTTEGGRYTLPLITRTEGEVQLVDDQVVVIQPRRVFVYFEGHVDKGRALPPGRPFACDASKVTLIPQGENQ